MLPTLALAPTGASQNRRGPVCTSPPQHRLEGLIIAFRGGAVGASVRAAAELRKLCSEGRGQEGHGVGAESRSPPSYQDFNDVRGGKSNSLTLSGSSWSHLRVFFTGLLMSADSFLQPARLPRPCKAVVLWSDTDPRILLGLRSEHFQLLGTSEAAKGNLTDSQLILIGIETACKRTEQRLRSSVPRS